MLFRSGPAATLRACYEASGAGYVLQREFATWGIACTVIAPSLIPTKPGVQRKHDKYDASQLARLFRAGELTAVHIPTEAEERVRDLVRCRSTFQREILKSRHTCSSSSRGAGSCIARARRDSNRTTNGCAGLRAATHHWRQKIGSCLANISRCSSTN